MGTLANTAAPNELSCGVLVTPVFAGTVGLEGGLGGFVAITGAGGLTGVTAGVGFRGATAGAVVVDGDLRPSSPEKREEL